MSEKNGTCTCGQCFEGWLSPKMRECLECESASQSLVSRATVPVPIIPASRVPCPFPDSAEVRYQLAKSLLDTQDGVGEEITSVLPIDYTRIDTSVRYLPDAIRDRLRPESNGRPSPIGDTVYRGYVRTFKAIRDLVGEGSEDSGGDKEGERKGVRVDAGFPSVSAVAAKLQAIRARKMYLLHEIYFVRRTWWLCDSRTIAEGVE
ncbi:hypothetical protein V8D89_015041 [Ganoderma adspersum]